MTALQNITVNLSFAGTAVSGINYVVSGVTAIIVAGTNAVNFVINSINNLIFQGNTTVTTSITSLSGMNATTGTQNTATTTILDNETTPQILLSVNTGSIVESGGTVVFTLATSGNVTNIKNSRSSGILRSCRCNGVDYSTGTTSITIPAGSTGTSFSLNALKDTLAEGAETIVVDIASVTNGLEAGTQQQIVIIIDGPSVPVVTLAGSSSITLAQGSIYYESGIVWTDTYDGSGVILIPVSGTVNTGIVGTYTLYYTYINANGLTGNIVTRTVIVSSDVDTDGVSNTVENAAPNSGDANNDGIQDALQANVASQFNGVTNQYVTMITTGSCAVISGLTFENESGLTVQDSIKDYKL